MRSVTLADGVRIPLLGQGTWQIGERKNRLQSEVAALQLGIDLGMTLLDTAEMYADGGAEQVVGAAIAGRRDQVFLVSKVLPENASRLGTLAACERSLRRLHTDHLDLYLLHWESSHPLAETVLAFEQLRAEGKIRRWGVSNFDLVAVLDTLGLEGGRHCAANQVLYNLAHRGIEWSLLGECQRRNVLVMAYSPLDQGRLLRQPSLVSVARRHGVAPAQVALAWTMRLSGVVSIPKSASLEHVRANRAAADLQLTSQDLAELDREFAPPQRETPLETI
jgi:diketogulonate reductase-like aldo/keto reductase